MTEKRKVKITDTILRDAHQSLLATRMKTDDMLRITDQLNQVGYHSVEMWGGATFDTALRYLNEDPWQRLRDIKKAMPDTPLQMLLRGQNLLGYWQFPDDVVKEFVKLAVKNGIDVVRIFDALNDPRNMKIPIEETKKAGGHAQGAVVYTTSPVHDLEHYVETATELSEFGADSICIKDMAGLLTPYRAYELVKTLKESVGLPVQVHSHYTSGMAGMAYLKAIEAGADVVDTALSALAFGTSQPATETIVSVLEGTEYDTGIDVNLLTEVNSYFKKLRNDYSEFYKTSEVDTRVLVYQVPGGMLSNLNAQLTQQNMIDKLDDVLEEVPRVREDLGYPPLVTPMSQIVGTQAVFNVATGKRYSVKSKEIRDYVKGFYGRPPAPISDEVREKIIGDDEVITVRPATLFEPRLEKARDDIKEYIRQDEDVLSYILFPDPALKYFKQR